VEEDEAEEEEAEHHGEGGRVIRISGDDEAFVLSVLQRSNGDLGGMIEFGESDSVVIDFELVNAINIREFESRDEVSIDWDQGSADERVDANKFQLHVFGLERHPSVWRQFFDLNRIDDILHDGISSRGVSFAVQMMLDFADSQDSVLFENPLGQGRRQGLVGRSHRITACTFHASAKELVAEKVQRPDKDDSGVVARLQSGDEKRVLADCVGKFLDLLVGIEGISGRRSGQNREDQRILRVRRHSDSAEKVLVGSRGVPDDHGSFDEILRLGDDERVLSFVLLVVVKVIDDGGVFLVELDSAFRSQLLDGLADVGGAGDEDIAAAVDETRDRGDVQLPAEALHRRREDDEVIVQKLAVFDQREGRVVGRFESQFETAIFERPEESGMSLFDEVGIEKNERPSPGEDSGREERKRHEAEKEAE